ncbi:MAG: hypothetical protein R2867_25160 [Caldilineaceae bacterium]
MGQLTVARIGWVIDPVNDDPTAADGTKLIPIDPVHASALVTLNHR